MMFQLEEERKVTANLSRTLELEKRKVRLRIENDESAWYMGGTFFTKILAWTTFIHFVQSCC